MSKLQVVHYLNQFFGGIGSEDQADQEPRLRQGAVGPGQLLQRALGDEAEVAATVLCGDNFINEHSELAGEQIAEYVTGLKPDLFVAGPAFNAGRYGMGCGIAGTAVQERLKTPAITGMYPDNPAVELYRKQLYIVPTAATAIGMSAAIGKMASLGLKLARGERVGLPADEGYLARGLRFTERLPRPAAERAVEMLLTALRGGETETEWPLPQYDRVAAPPPIADLSRARLMLITSGGVVPKGNPDRIESTRATKWLKYSLAGIDSLSPDAWQSVHGGYDTTDVNKDPNRVLPIDAVRQLESEGVIGQLFETYFVTVGSAASTTTARRFGQEMASELSKSPIDGVIYVST